MTMGIVSNLLTFNVSLLLQVESPSESSSMQQTQGKCVCA